MEYATMYDFVGALMDEFPEAEKTLEYENEMFTFICVRYKSTMQCFCDKDHLEAKTIYENGSRGCYQCRYNEFNAAVRVIRGFYKKAEEIAEYNPLCRDCEMKEMKHVCGGKHNEFSMCFRRIGSVKGIEPTICQGDSVQDLLEKSALLKATKYDSYSIDEVIKENMNCYTGTLFGKLYDCNGKFLSFPLGFVRFDKIK